jgi:hypothetical protein
MKHIPCPKTIIIKGYHPICIGPSLKLSTKNVHGATCSLHFDAKILL